MTFTDKKTEIGCTDDFLNALRESVRMLDPKDMLRFYEKRIQGQGDTLRMAVYSVFRFLENAAGTTSAPADNWVLTAPSGCGKTEFYRVTRDYFEQRSIPVPVIQIDLSLITEEGFKGDNPTIIPLRILDMEPNCGGVAICFLDEADKKFIPSYTTYGSDVNLAIQGNLLTLTEGIVQSIPVSDTEVYRFDSGKTMFVFLGAFQPMRKEKAMKEKKLSSIGFAAEPERLSEEDVFYADLELDDFIKYGMTEELAGRINYVINFRRLSKEDMLSLIRTKTGEISENMGIKIKLTENGANDLLKLAFGPLGVRAPLNLMKKLAQTTVSRVFFDGGFNRGADCVVIDGADNCYISKRGIYKNGAR